MKQIEKNILQPDTLDQVVKKHIHNGLDAPRLSPKYFLGFTNTNVNDATVAPTDSALNGTIRFLYDASHYYMWVRLNNSWRYVALI